MAVGRVIIAALGAAAIASPAWSQFVKPIQEGGFMRDTDWTFPADVVGNDGPKSSKDQPTRLSGIVVSSRCPKPRKAKDGAATPRIVSTYPARGAVVRPGLLMLRVTFNAPMACGGAFFSEGAFENPCPGDGPSGERVMFISPDRRTFTALCAVEPGAAYGLWVNYPGMRNAFANLDGRPSEPYDLGFSTSSDKAVLTPAEALDQDLERNSGLPGRDAPALLASREPLAVKTSAPADPESLRGGGRIVSVRSR